ncbi:polysaccharide biosynthesis tyrosine autokinase [Acidobacterium sp. S8]|uniref:GumC family protein n=1 Tax=Acidobacterium sp. S8 TaxID=1641854 RepID=UPI00131CAF1C|nr:polysaccharide biosynthesis tyrosine autokinase [Acidobacterium sp. S8]
MNQSLVTEPILTSADTETDVQRAGVSAGWREEEPLGNFIQLVKKRGWLVIAASLIGLVCGTTANLILQKQYTARASIEVTPDISGQFRLEQVTGGEGAGVDSVKIDTEIAILKSPTLLLETIKSLQLNKNPDFCQVKAGVPWDLSKPAIRSALISILSGSLDITRQGHTNIIEIRVTSNRPDLASLIANTLIDNYIAHSFKDSYTATEQVSRWLGSQLGGIQERLQQSQERMLSLQRDIGVVGLEDQTHSVLLANLEELNKNLADAQEDRLLKEARLKSLQESPPAIIAEITGQNPALQSTKQRLVQLQAEYTSLIQTYGPAYAPIKEVSAQIDELQKLMAQDESAEISRMKKEFEAAQANENMVRKALEEQEQKAYGLNSKALQYLLAKREYEANRTLYDGLQERLQEAGIVAGLHSTAIHVVDNADTPAYPSRPRTNLNMVAGLGGGLLLGIALAVLLETLDTNLKTITEIEQTLQLPVLAAVPKIDPNELSPASLLAHSEIGGSGSWSKIAEALRGLRTSVMLSSPGAPPKVLMITSTFPAEGKSVIAILGSIIFSLNGPRVLLIDADMRRPTAHLRFHISNRIGLSSVLSGKATLKEAIQSWEAHPNFHILSSGPIPPLPSELLGSNQMRDLLEQARSQYDFVFIDTPPVLAVTDATILAGLADCAILVVRYGQARRHVVSRTVELLERSRAHMLGVVVNLVDFRSPEYAEYYGRKYNDYYGERTEQRDT